MFVAVAFPVLIGGIGLGAEAGYWYLRERALQHSADMSAYGAAVRLKKGDSDSILDKVALHIATEFRLSVFGWDDYRASSSHFGRECRSIGHGRGYPHPEYPSFVFRLLPE